MKLTPLAKVFVTLVVLAVVGYTGWHYFQDDIRCWSSPDKCKVAGDPKKVDSPNDNALTKDDFNGVKEAPADPARNGVTVTGNQITGNKLDRPLRVGINTWA